MDGPSSFAQSLKHWANEGHIFWLKRSGLQKNPGDQLTNKYLGAEAALDVKDDASKPGCADLP
jgi:hypothetical protein